MNNFLLIGAGFTRNWGGPLSEEITGSLLGDLNDDDELTLKLRSGPFESAFQGFNVSTGSPQSDAKLHRFQNAVTELFSRLNKTLVQTRFEFDNQSRFPIKAFLAKFDAIFSLNQDLLLEIHYRQSFGQEGNWSGVNLPGMEEMPQAVRPILHDPTMVTWRPALQVNVTPNQQPLYKLHGSSNWYTEAGKPMLIMGNDKSGAIDRFPILKAYHEHFASSLNRNNARLMVVGYGFQDDHINNVILNASQQHGLATFLVDPRGSQVLEDPNKQKGHIWFQKMEKITLIGELRRPLSVVFGGDNFAYGELMRFFQKA